ncbi:unnamed protein product [Calypogeia fissa]
MVSTGDFAKEFCLPEEETSSTTQPYVEDDEWEQLYDTGCSIPAGKINAANENVNANHVQSRGVISPTCGTRSPFPTSRVNFQSNAAAAKSSLEQCAALSSSKLHINGGAIANANLVQSRGIVSPTCRTPAAFPPNSANFRSDGAAANSTLEQQCAAPSLSKLHGNGGASSSSRELRAPSFSAFPINAAAANSNGSCSPPTLRQANGASIEFPPVSSRESLQNHCRSEGALSTGTKDDDAVTEGTGDGFWYSGQTAVCTPLLPGKDEASASATPVRTPPQGTEKKPVCQGAEYTRKRPASRELFAAASSPEKARKIIYSDVTQIQRQLNGLTVQTESSDCQLDAGTTCLTTDLDKRREFGEPKRIPWPVLSPYLRALGSLEFTKAFQLLEILNGRNLEETFEVSTIERLKTVPTANVRTHLRQLDAHGRNFDTREASFAEKPRFECCVDSTGILTFKISEQREGLTALQRCFGPDRVLRVFFAEGSQCRQTMKEGIIVGLRYYQYWTHKDTGKDYEKQKKKPVDEKFSSSIHCYFVCTSSEAEADKKNEGFKQFKTIYEARCYIMHIHTTPNIAKYITRLQLALSQTQHIDLDFSTVTVKLEEDIHCKDEKTGLETICTDGAGYISVDLAKEIAMNLEIGMPKPEKVFGTQRYPSLIQIRLFHKGSASKGTLLAHNKLDRRTIILRKSMQKVGSDPELSEFQSFNSLEICGYSKPPRDAKLSRDLIVLLTLGGVPRSFFTNLVDKAIEEERDIFSDRLAAWNAIQDWNTEWAKLARRMLLAGIPPKEPFLQKTIMELRKDLLQDYRKGKVPLPDSCYLYGTADPSGTLEPNQVAITMGYGLVSWPKVAVYKCPGKHPGDIHIFEAVANKEIQDIVGNGKYVIFFSTKGPRSIPDEIANSDLDGDKYFVTWNTELLSYYKEQQTRWLKNPEESGESAMCKPSSLAWEKLEDKLIDEFIDARFSSRNDIGTVANWWVTHMDMYLFLSDRDEVQSEFHYNQAMNLIGYFYALVDSEKTGIKVHYPSSLRPQESPHFLEKNEEGKNVYTKDKPFGYGNYFNLGESQDMPEQSTIIYQSTTVLGEIYEKALRTEENWRRQAYENLELEQAFQIKQINFSFSDVCNDWGKKLKAYKAEMKAHMESTKSDPSTREAGCSAIYLKYRRLLYEADSLDDSRRELGILFAHASAIYAEVYQDARGRGTSPDFAWKVAGVLLCRMYEKYHRPKGEDAVIVSELALECIIRRRSCQDNTQDTASPFEEDWDVS